MSRVVAMIAGDIEVSAVTSSPGYLTHWTFNDDISFMSSNTSAHYSISTSTSMVSDSNCSPFNVTKPMLHDIAEEAT